MTRFLVLLVLAVCATGVLADGAEVAAKIAGALSGDPTVNPVVDTAKKSIIVSVAPCLGTAACAAAAKAKAAALSTLLAKTVKDNAEGWTVKVVFGVAGRGSTIAPAAAPKTASAASALFKAALNRSRYFSRIIAVPQGFIPTVPPTEAAWLVTKPEIIQIDLTQGVMTMSKPHYFTTFTAEQVFADAFGLGAFNMAAISGACTGTNGCLKGVGPFIS